MIDFMYNKKKIILYFKYSKKLLIYQNIMK